FGTLPAHSFAHGGGHGDGNVEGVNWAEVKSRERGSIVGLVAYNHNSELGWVDVFFRHALHVRQGYGFDSGAVFGEVIRRIAVELKLGGLGQNLGFAVVVEDEGVENLVLRAGQLGGREGFGLEFVNLVEHGLSCLHGAYALSGSGCVEHSGMVKGCAVGSIHGIGQALLRADVLKKS